MLNFTGKIELLKNVCNMNTDINGPCYVQDPTLHNFILPYGINIPYHFPPSIENIIVACFLVASIWALKKYIVPEFKRELENKK